jgi:hypothetical protein
MSGDELLSEPNEHGLKKWAAEDFAQYPDPDLM